MERFRELDEAIFRQCTQDPRRQDEYEGRLMSLAPIRDSMAAKMRLVRDIFGASEEYISRLTTIIQRLMASVDMSLYTLKRAYLQRGGAAGAGDDAVREQLVERLLPFSDSFPTGVTTDFIVTNVCDFLKDECR